MKYQFIQVIKTDGCNQEAIIINSNAQEATAAIEEATVTIEEPLRQLTSTAMISLAISMGLSGVVFPGQENKAKATETIESDVIIIPEQPQDIQQVMLDEIASSSKTISNPEVTVSLPITFSSQNQEKLELKKEPIKTVPIAKPLKVAQVQSKDNQSETIKYTTTPVTNVVSETETETNIYVEKLRADITRLRQEYTNTRRTNQSSSYVQSDDLEIGNSLFSNVALNSDNSEHQFFESRQPEAIKVKQLPLQLDTNIQEATLETTSTSVETQAEDNSESNIYVEKLRSEIARLRQEYANQRRTNQEAKPTIIANNISEDKKVEPRLPIERINRQPLNPPQTAPSQINASAPSNSAQELLEPAATNLQNAKPPKNKTQPQLSPPVLPNVPERPKFNGYAWPARGVLTSGYGWRWGRMHRGIDIANSVGTPIMAAADGEVIFAGWNTGGFGNLVKIRHADGSETLYAHNSRLLVHQGQFVQKGQQIATMGSTGLSTGPHLHFEVHPPGRGAVNPIAFLPQQRPN